ncbi:GMC oxidoreductase [Streptomyces roseifaciens]|uniref:GMC oxidoreductase n=1 Tax=Streptomyces roseifaciens TaxID=1488406 RepID=UPI00099FD555
MTGNGHWHQRSGRNVTAAPSPGSVPVSPLLAGPTGVSTLGGTPRPRCHATSRARPARLAGRTARRPVRNIARRPALRDRGGRPFLLPRSDADGGLEDFVRHTGCSTYHPTSTCAIGRVVDSRLRVLGIEGLRVADASVLPSVPRGNTNAAAVMVAEKAADLIRERGLRPAVPGTVGIRLLRARQEEEKPGFGPARRRLVELSADHTPVDPGELDRLWGALETVQPNQILGTWRGAVLNTGHSAGERLRALRWYGKPSSTTSRRPTRSRSWASWPEAASPRTASATSTSPCIARSDG